MTGKSFLRWKPVSISLVVLAGIYLGVALLNLWLVRVSEQQGDTRNVRFLLWGAFWNMAIGALCVGGRRLIRTCSRRGCALGVIVVATALFISARNLLGSWLTGRSVLPGLEAVLVWPWLVYAILFAADRLQAQTLAEPCAPPNRGRTAGMGSSEVSGGPPPVS